MATYAPLLAVLTDRSLLSHIARFQRGLPIYFVELRTAFIASFPVGFPTGNLRRQLWDKVVRDCELRLVQKLHYFASLPEYEASKELEIDDLPSFAAVRGRVDVLAWLDSLPEQRPAVCPWRGDMCRKAMGVNHYHVAQWLLRNRPETCVDWMPQCLELVACHGDLALLQEFMAFAPRAMSSAVMDGAARCDHLEMLKYLHEHSAACTTEGMDGAASNGHLEVVRYLHEHRTEGCTTDAMDNAARSGHFEVVRFLHVNRVEGCTTKAMDNAASSGRLDIVRFLHENRTEGCTTNAMDGAAFVGALEVVEYLHTHRTEGCTEEAMELAAEKGHAKVVRFLHEKLHLGISPFGVTKVLRAGHLEVIKYLYEHVGVTFDKYATANASQSGNTELVEYVAGSGANK
jgi:hypothetical protein